MSLAYAQTCTTRTRTCARCGGKLVMDDSGERNGKWCLACETFFPFFKKKKKKKG